MSLSKITMSLLLFALPFIVMGQRKVNSKDSTDIKNQIEGFYSWYIDMIKGGRLNSDFNPEFVRRSDGFTTLDFTQYRDGLRKFGFSELFIQRRIDWYEGCLRYLNKILYDKISQLKDLDEFESINCDLSNRYEWTGGMEPKDSAQLWSLKLMDKKTIIGNVIFTSYAKSNGRAIVTLKKIQKQWQVDNLVLE